MFYNAFNDIKEKSNSYHFQNKINLLSQPEFNDADKIRNIVSKLENKDVISNIEEVNNGVNVYIGHDSNIDDDVTVIKTKYNINGEEGTLAVIGPKRMEYDKVVGILDYIKKEIEKK